MKDINSMFLLYKNIYNLENINIKGIQDNTINFLFFDAELKFYTICDKSILSYRFDSGIIEIITNIEEMYKIKIINYLPICYINKVSLVIACKISKYHQKDEDVSILKEKKYDRIIDLVKKKAVYYSEEYDDEAITIEKYNHRYKIYNNCIKKTILNERRRNKEEFLSLLKKICGKYTSVIDVSCGDNLDISRISDENNIVVYNDISLYQLKCCQLNTKNVLFTNDNILNLNFKKSSFDVSYCKNTLHHMNNDKEIRKVLNAMYYISNRLIIVEIEDPQKTGGIPEILNKYLYTEYLKDAGRYFLNFEKFKKIIDSNFKNKCTINYLSFKNILGNYMIAIIEKR